MLDRISVDCRRTRDGRKVHLPFLSGGSGVLASTWRCRDGLSVEIDVSAYRRWDSGLLCKLFAAQWLLTIAEDFQQAQSPKIKRDVFPNEYSGKVQGVVKRSLKEARSSVAFFLAVEFVINGHSKRYGLVLTRDSELPTRLIAEIHQRVKEEFDVTLHFERMGPLRRVKHEVALLRKARLVVPVSIQSEQQKLSAGRVMSSGLPVFGLEHLPTFCIDASGTRCHEDAITAWQNRDGSIERWVFFPDRAYTDRFFPRVAVPTLGVGWVERDGAVVESKPLIAALVKAHRTLNEGDVVRHLDQPGDLPKRLVQALGTLRDSVAVHLGRAPTNSELGSVMVMNSILTAGHQVAKSILQAGVPLIVRPHYSRAPIIQLLMKFGISLKPWEIGTDGILAFKLLQAASQRELNIEELMSGVSGGVFRVAKGEELHSNEIAKLKGDRIDGRLNQEIVRRIIYGLESDSEEVLWRACDLLNSGLSRRGWRIKALVHSTEMQRMLALHQSGQRFSGRISGIDAGREEVLVNVDSLGEAILPAAYLQTGGGTNELAFTPVGWDDQRQKPFVALVTVDR